MKTLADYIRDLEGVQSAGMRFVSSSNHEEFMTYDSLYQESRRIMNGLLSIGVKPNDYIVIDIKEKRKFFPTFNACVLAGAVPIPLAAEDNRAFQKITHIVHDLDVPFLVTDSDRKSSYLALPGIADIKPNIIAHGEICETEQRAFPCVEPDRTCFVQFSSGSTNAPKGVVLTHRNILTNVFDIASSHALDKSDIALSWMPHTHDMGLIGQYIVYIVHKTPQIHISPSTFIRKPNLFLELLQKYHVTITCSPNFGLDWLVRNTDKSLFNEGSFRKLRIIINGAEPISPPVLARFQTLFREFGLRGEAVNPSYGLAEASLGVTFSDYRSKYSGIQISREDYTDNNTITITSENCNDVSENSIAMVSLGVPLPNVRLRILDECDQECPELKAGEIVIQGDNVTHGYVNKELSQELFVDGWLRTGDLGFLYKGELYFCGRKKDLICVNGKNFFSSDLEAEIRKSGFFPDTGDVVVSSAVFDGTESLLLFVKAKRLNEAFADKLNGAIAALQGATGETLTDCIPLRSIPKTTSGKLKRSELVRRYLKGEYKAEIARLSEMIAKSRHNRIVEPPRTDNENTLHSIWADALSIDPNELSVNDDFFGLGGTSILAVAMLGAIEEQFGREFGHDLLIQCKTIREMATYIDNWKPPGFDEDTKCLNINISPIEHDIAITGIGIRMPCVRDAGELWSFFRQGRSSIKEISPRRMQLLRDEAGLISYLGELSDIDILDYHQERFKSSELEWIDPHQKLLLNCSHEALQDGQFADGNEKDVGVYIGASQSSFAEFVLDKLTSSAAIPPGALVGSTLNTYAARISHLYDFRGPSMVFDTACSSGLVALNYALEDLNNNKISSALVGGANLVLGPGFVKLFNAAGVMSKKGSCSVFSTDADGIVIGEGAVVVYLQRLEDARNQGKKIYAVVKACSVNNNGRTIGIMAPRPEGQISVMKSAFKRSGISPSEIGYFEVHGTGTVLGDPIEVNSLKNVFSEDKRGANPCMLGSSKSNFGHLLAASGLLGLLRASLSIHHKEISPCINLGELNASIDIENSPFRIPTSPSEWKANTRRRACVNSFGFGGTNAHVILEECE